jgi:hypothetical protein
LEQGKYIGLFSGLLLISILAISQFGLIEAQTGASSVIKISLTPSVVESGLGSNSVGYVQFTNPSGDPIPAPSDIQVQLTSSDLGVASVPKDVVIPRGQEMARFDVTSVGDGETEISEQNPEIEEEIAI